MKKRQIKYSLIIAIVVSHLIFASALISMLQARSDGENVILEWQTTTEKNLKEFVVQRKTPNSQYMDLATVKPKGDNSFYSYKDQSAYKVNDTFYIYRLKIVDNDNSVSFSAEVSVVHQVSSVKRTWGSIKALFR